MYWMIYCDIVFIPTVLGSDGADRRIHTRRSIPPPPRRTSLGVVGTTVEIPAASVVLPSVQVSPPRPTRRPTSPPIITALPILQEPAQLGGDEDTEGMSPSTVYSAVS